MKVTLKKAAKLVDELKTALSGQRVLNSVRLSVLNDSGVNQGKYEEARNASLNAIKTRLAISDVIAEIRTSIAEQNVRSGISALLARKNSLDESLAFLVGQIRYSSSNDSFADFEVTSAHLRNQLKADKQVALNHDVSLSLDADINNLIAELRREVSRIGDELSAKNSSTKVTLSDSAVETLKALNLVD